MRFTQLSALISAAALSAGSISAFAKPVQLTDILGRKVTVDLPAKRVVLGFYYQDYMAIGGKTALDNVVGFSKAVWADWAPPSWAAFSKAVPKLNQLTDVGEVEVGTFSIEKVLALKPDLLVLAEWQYKALGSDLDRINKAGIPIVVLDYNAQTVAKHVQSTKLIGTLTGQQQKADKLAADYKRVADTIQARVQKANLPKPKVYIEFGNKGPAEHSVTFGKSMWGSMATLVGGNNIAASSVEFYGPINPEKVLAAKPDVIVITGRETELKKNPAAMVMGWGIPKAEAENAWQALPNAPAGPTCLRLKTTASTPPTTLTRARCPTARRFSLWPKRFIRSCLRISTLRRPIWTSTAKTCPSYRTARSTSIRKDNKVI